MGKIGFWQLLLDDRMSWWEAQRINEASDAAEIAQHQANNASFRASQLQARVDALSREVVMLRTAVTVLVHTLKDTDVIDDRLLDARLEAALDEAFAPPEPARVAPEAPEARRLTCIKCRQNVLASTTTMTADGPMCDRCPVG